MYRPENLEVLNQDQKQRLVANGIGALSTGMASRHREALRHTAGYWVKVVSVIEDPELIRRWAETSKRYLDASGAEAPVAFLLTATPRDTPPAFRRLAMVNVDMQTGQEIRYSRVDVGILRPELTMRGAEPENGFTVDDMSFAMKGLEAQKDAGIVYTLQLEPSEATH